MTKHTEEAATHVTLCWPHSIENNFKIKRPASVIMPVSLIMPQTMPLHWVKWQSQRLYYAL